MLLGTATGWPPSATSTACTVPSASASTVPSAAASTSPAAFLPFPCTTAVCLPAALPSAKELFCHPPPAHQAFTPAAFKAFSSPPTAAKAGSGHPATGLLLPECRGRPSATEDCPGAADTPHSAPHPHQGHSGHTPCPQVPGGPASQPLAHSPALNKQDPMLALNSLSKNPMAQQELATDLSISHRKPSQAGAGQYRPIQAKHQSLPQHLAQVQAPTQALHRPTAYGSYHPPASALPTHILPAPLGGLSPKQEVIELDSKPSSPALSDHGYSVSSPEPDQLTRKGLMEGVHVTTKASKTNSIKLVLQRDQTDTYNITEMMIRDGSMSNHSIDTKAAVQALKTKTKVARKQRLN